MKNFDHKYCSLLEYGHFFDYFSKYKACCLSKAELPTGNFINRQSLESSWIKRNCERCIVLEEQGQKSQRTYLNEYFESEIKDYLYLDIRLSNKCNLACSGCSPEYSSTWASYKDKSKSLLKVDKIEEINHIVSSSNKNIYLYFAGGEPLLIHEHFDVIRNIKSSLLDERKLKIHFLTNLTLLNPAFLETLEPGETLFGISLDSWLDANDYIRFPSNHKLIFDNFKKLKSLGFNDFYIQPTISLLNIFHLREFVDLVELFRKELKLNINFYPHLMFEPEAISLYYSPPPIKELIKEEINYLIDGFSKFPEMRDFINLLTNLIPSLEKKEGRNQSIENIRNYLAEQDSIRGSKLREGLPNLYRVLNG